MDNPVIIFGTGYLGRTAKDIFESNENVVYGFLDDNKQQHGSEIDDATVLGNTDDDGFLKLIGKKCEAFIAIDDNRLHKNLVKVLNEVRHVQPVNAIHRTAVISGRAQLGHGNLVDQGVHIGSGAKLGNHTVIQSGAVLGAEVVISDYVQIGSGSVINSGARIEDEAFVGSGAIIISGITIGKGARIGAGSVVIASVGAGETVFGNPAQKVKA